MKNLHSYSWLVLDIDGTTVTSDKVLDPKTRDVLVALQTQGIRIVLASGRPLEGIYPIAKQLVLILSMAIWSLLMVPLCSITGRGNGCLKPIYRTLFSWIYGTMHISMD